MLRENMDGLHEWYDLDAEEYDPEDVIVDHKNFPIPSLLFEEVQLKECFWQEKLGESELKPDPDFQYTTAKEIGDKHRIAKFSANEINEKLLEEGFKKTTTFKLPPVKKKK